MPTYIHTYINENVAWLSDYEMYTHMHTSIHTYINEHLAWLEILVFKIKV